MKSHAIKLVVIAVILRGSIKCEDEVDKILERHKIKLTDLDHEIVEYTNLGR